MTHTRRNFIRQLSLQAGGLFFLPQLMAEETFTLNKIFDENINRKLGIALVGLGRYSEEQLGPALKETSYCKLTSIVTGTPSKVEKWTKEYEIPPRNVYNYDNFEKIKENKDIDIVYVVLPNALHAEFVIKAAKAGKHVICEKPMAISAKDCEAMIQACKGANRMLSIGYRLHFEPHNLEMMRLAKQKVFGQVKKVIAEDGMNLPGGTWRTDKELAGGGPLMDVGIYCVQGAIYTLGTNPIAVTAKEGEKTDVERFKEVAQSIAWTMDFGNGVTADCKTSYAENMNLLRAETDKGRFELSPAYAYKGIKGRHEMKDDMYTQPMEVEKIKSQQSIQMDDFAKCIMNGTKTKVPGEMGLRDVKILTAIYEAAKTGKKIPLAL